MSHLGNAAGGRNRQEAILTEVLAELRTLSQHSTQFAARLGGQSVNNVLLVETFTFPAIGYWTRSFQVAAGALEISNPSAHTITVTSAPPTALGSAPTGGVGVYVIPAGTVRVVNLASHVFTLYGTSGDQAGVQVLTTGGGLSSGLLAVNGGGVV